MRDYYAEFLEKKQGNVSVNEVSKVSKAPNYPFDTFVTSQTSTNQDNFFADTLAAIDQSSPQPQSAIITTLNSIIERGNLFNVTENNFEIIGEITEVEKDYLRINKEPILCTLQQSLLMKYLFSHSKYLFSDFAFEIAEAQTRRVEANCLFTYEVYFEAVREVSKKWFVRILN